jgi:hypothetical protein
MTRRNGGRLAIRATPPSLRFTARTHGTLLVAPAALLHEWVKTYPQMMQNLFHTLSDRFKVVAGVAARSLPSPRLGIVATSRRGCVLAGRLAARLLAAGERLRVWAGQPSSLTSTGNWPDALPIHELAASDTPLLQPPAPEVDRQIVVWSPGSNGRRDFKQLLGCDEVLWLLEPRDAAHVSQDVDSLNSLTGELAQKVRIVWLLDADTPVAPLLSGWSSKADVKSRSNRRGRLTRQERRGLDRLVRALRHFGGHRIGWRRRERHGPLRRVARVGSRTVIRRMSGSAPQWRAFFTPRACRPKTQSRTSSMI